MQPLFRPAALQHLAVGDDLNDPVRVVGLGSWIILAGIGMLLVATMLWMLTVSVTTTIDGRGALVGTASQSTAIIFVPRDRWTEVAPGMAAMLTTALGSVPAHVVGVASADEERAAGHLSVTTPFVRSLQADVPVLLAADRPLGLAPGALCQATVTVSRRRLVQLVLP